MAKDTSPYSNASKPSGRPNSSHTSNPSAYSNTSQYAGSPYLPASSDPSYTSVASPVSIVPTLGSITAPNLRSFPDSIVTYKNKPPIHSSKWYLDAYASPDLPLNKWGRFSYTTGFRLGRSFGQHFSGAIGLQYSHIREDISEVDSMRRDYNLDLKTLDIPLLIGYKTNLGRQKITITGGAIINIRSWEIPISYYTVGNIYKTNTGLSLYLGLNYPRPLGKKFSLFAEPYVRYRLSNMTDDPFIFPKKIHVAGLSLGLRYNL